MPVAAGFIVGDLDSYSLVVVFPAAGCPCAVGFFDIEGNPSAAVNGIV